MEEQRSLLRQLIVERKAWVFVAGNAKQMPDQVTQALKDALGDDSNEFDQLVKQSRLQLETWS
jgi:sulfite reductase alpha subunit-like flavoprotein